MTEAFSFIENVASNAAGGLTVILLAFILRKYLSTAQGKQTSQFLLKKSEDLGRWVTEGPAAEKLTVVFGLCFLVTTCRHIASDSVPISVQLPIVFVAFPTMVYGVYLLLRSLKRGIVARVRERLNR